MRGGGPRGRGRWAEGGPTRQSHLGGGGLAWVHVALMQGETPTLRGWGLATGMMGRRVAVGERGGGGGRAGSFSGGGRATLDGQPFLGWPSPTLAWPRRGTRRRCETPLARSGSRTTGWGGHSRWPVAQMPRCLRGEGKGDGAWNVSLLDGGWVGDGCVCQELGGVGGIRHVNVFRHLADAGPRGGIVCQAGGRTAWWVPVTYGTVCTALTVQCLRTASPYQSRPRWGMPHRPAEAAIIRHEGRRRALPHHPLSGLSRMSPDTGCRRHARG